MQKLFNYFFPHFCLLCKTKVSRVPALDLCVDCEKDLPLLINACPRCAAPLDNTEISLTACGNCLNRDLPFDRTLALFHYRESISHLLTSLKFQGKLTHAKVLSELLADYFAEYYRDLPKPELIIPVPLHKKRLRERGYNQALELALPIAEKLKIPLDKHSCMRTKATEAQTHLKARERKQNLRAAFSLDKPISAKYVAVFDDIITTGSTVYELSKLLRASGVTTIDVWCCARASLYFK
jgi:ComF family protein